MGTELPRTVASIRSWSRRGLGPSLAVLSDLGEVGFRWYGHPTTRGVSRPVVAVIAEIQGDERTVPGGSGAAGPSAGSGTP
jgi:hypothetical protein